MNYICSTCGFTCSEEEAVDASDLHERIDEGGVYTTKECPACGYLTYPTEGYVVDLQNTIYELRERISQLEDAQP